MLEENINKYFDIKDPEVLKIKYKESCSYFILRRWFRKKNSKIKMRKVNVSTIFIYKSNSD